MRHKMSWLWLPGMAAVLAGCSTPMFTMPPGPHEYRIGFHDGCDDGYAYAGSPFYGLRESAQPTGVGEVYLSGWQAGFERCKGSYQQIQKTVSSVLGPP